MGREEELRPHLHGHHPLGVPRRREGQDRRGLVQGQPQGHAREPARGPAAERDAPCRRRPTSCPHRPPFLFVDEVVELEPGHRPRASGASPATRRSSPVTSRADRPCPACSWSRPSPSSVRSPCCRRALRGQAAAVRWGRRRPLPASGRARRHPRARGRAGRMSARAGKGTGRARRRRGGLRGRAAVRPRRRRRPRSRLGDQAVGRVLGLIRANRGRRAPARRRCPKVGPRPSARRRVHTRRGAIGRPRSSSAPAVAGPRPRRRRQSSSSCCSSSSVTNSARTRPSFGRPANAGAAAHPGSRKSPSMTTGSPTSSRSPITASTPGRNTSSHTWAK